MTIEGSAHFKYNPITLLAIGRGTDVDYDRIYREFIADRQNRTVSGDSDVHHIVPRSMGGDDSKGNLIRLSVEDHVRAHVLLGAIYGGSQWLPVWYMIHGYGKNEKNKRVVPTKLQRKTLALSRRHVCQRMRDDNPMKSPEVAARVADSSQKRMSDPVAARRASEAMHTPEARAKRLETLKSSEAWERFQEKQRGEKREWMRGEKHFAYNATEYHWKNVKTGEKVTATKRTMQERFGGASSNWNKVVKGVYASTCQWALATTAVKVKKSDVVHAWRHADTGEEKNASCRGLSLSTGATVAAFSAVVRGATRTAKGWTLA